MKPATAPTARLRTAIALSIVAHLCALSLLALVLAVHPAQRWRDDAGAPASSVFLTHITHRPPVGTKPISAPATGEPVVIKSLIPRVGRTRPAAIAQIRPASKSLSPKVPRSVRAPTTANAAPVRPARGLLARERFARAPAPLSAAPSAVPTAFQTSAPVRAGLATPTPAVALATPTPSPTQTASPTPRPTQPALPTPHATTTPVRAADTSFSGLFSQNYPPALLAPEIITAVRAHLGGHLHVRISVDERGHATDVRFLAPIADTALAESLRAKLLAVDYVPADCNGLHCDGVLEIVY